MYTQKIDEAFVEDSKEKYQTVKSLDFLYISCKIARGLSSEKISVRNATQL